jgi:3-hydroxy-9,10-secoandrosta-1,3,5(10)-triene-9,17-dione monooxygenase
VPDQTIADLLQSGLFGIATPQAWGGSELDPRTWVEVISTLASGCGSTGWVYGVLLGHMWLVALFPRETQAEIFGTPGTLVASLVRLGGSSPARVPGGYRWRAASGRFCSGVDHSDWVVAGGEVQSEAGTAERRWFLIPRQDFEIEDDWFTSGLRGTGSKSIRVPDAFIPEARSILQSDVIGGSAPGVEVNRGPLYRLPGSTWAFGLAATPIGLARGAVETLRDGLARRFAGLRGDALAEQSATLAAFGTAAAEVDVAYRLLLARAERLMETSERPYSAIERVEHRRDVTYAVQHARQAVNSLMELAGGSGIYDSAQIQRHWRDCNAAAAHASFSWNLAATAYGRAQLGLPPAGSDPFAR